MKVKVYLCVLVLQVVICSVWCQDPTTKAPEEELVTEMVMEDTTTVAAAPTVKVSPAAAVTVSVNGTKAADTDGDNDDDDDDDDSAEDDDDEDADSLSGGAVAGIIIGVILGLVLIIIIVYVVISKVCTQGESQPAPAKKQSDVKYSEVEKGETAADKVAEEGNNAEAAEVKA